MSTSLASACEDCVAWPPDSFSFGELHSIVDDDGENEPLCQVGKRRTMFVVDRDVLKEKEWQTPIAAHEIRNGKTIVWWKLHIIFHDL